MSRVINTRCDRCGYQSSGVGYRWLAVHIAGRTKDGEFALNVDLCSRECLDKWLASPERPWVGAIEPRAAQAEGAL